MDNIISSGINQVNILGKRLPKLLQGNRKRAFRDLVRFVFQLLIWTETDIHFINVFAALDNCLSTNSYKRITFTTFECMKT